MSNDAINWARRVRGISSTQKLVLWSLADQANEANECWPSVVGTAADCCLTERAVRMSLRALEAAGLITADHGGGRHRTTLYRLAVTDGETRNVMPPFRQKGERHSGNVVPERGHHVPERGNVIPERGNDVPPNPKEPSRTQRNHKKETREVSAPSVVVPDWLPADAWQAWCDYRRGRRWTAEAARLSIRNLGKLRDEGNDPRAVIEQSIANGWTGLFPDKQRRAAPAPAKQSALSQWADLLRAPEPPSFDFDLTAEEIKH